MYSRYSPPKRKATEAWITILWWSQKETANNISSIFHALKELYLTKLLPSDYWERQLKNHDIKWHETVNVRHVFYTFKVFCPNDGGNGFPRNVDFTKLQGVISQKTVNFLCFRWSISELTLNFLSSLDVFILGYCWSCHREKAGWYKICMQNVAIIGMQHCIFEEMCSMVKKKKLWIFFPWDRSADYGYENAGSWEN